MSDPTGTTAPDERERQTAVPRCSKCGLRFTDKAHICAPWCEPCQERHSVGYYGGTR